MTHPPLRAHFLVDARSQLQSHLLNQVGLSPIRARRLLDLGAVYVNGRRARSDGPIERGDVVRVHFQPKRFPYLVPAKVYEDDDLVIIDKPAGLPTHPTLDNYLENAWQISQKVYGQSLYVTHRLDVQTEGLLIFAKSPDRQSFINGLFAKRAVTKIYRAWTETPMPIGQHRHFMDLESPPPKPIFVESAQGRTEALLTIEKNWADDLGFGCEIRLETGRTHQIRAQLAALGGPILGDHLYGSSKKYVRERLALECFHLSFAHRSRTIGVYRPTPLMSPHTTKDFQSSQSEVVMSPKI